jgi:hypothetical protein
VGGSGGNSAGAVGFGESFHAQMVGGERGCQGPVEREILWNQRKINSKTCEWLFARSRN